MSAKVNFLKESRKTILCWGGMLGLGIAIDFFYWLGFKYWASWNAVTFLQNCHITYSSLFKVLGSNFGVIVTMVGMFFSINNNISERFEKKVYGIARIELYSEENKFYKYLKRMCMCAPLLMLIFLNIEFCVSGYFVFVYCIFFLLLYYGRHASSFSNPDEKVLKRLKKDLPKEGAWNRETFSEFQILLENIGRSVEEEGNWQGAKNLYKKFLESTQEYDDVKRYLITFYFYQVVFWKREKRSHIAPMQILWAYIRKLDIEAANEKEIPEKDWPVFWGMAKAAVSEADEEELIRFLKDFFDYAERGRKVTEGAGKKDLKPQFIEEQAGVLLVLMEYKLEDWIPQNDQLIDLLRSLWRYGSPAFENMRNEFAAKLISLSKNIFEDNESLLNRVIENLKEDCCSLSKLRKSLIANILFYGQEENDG